MELLIETWPERSVGEGTLNVYWRTLQHLDDEVFIRSVERCIRESTFFPKPAEVLKRAREVLEVHGLLPPDPEQAWVAAMGAISRSSTDGLDSDLIKQVIRELGGARHLGQTPSNQMAHVRRDFISRYEFLRDRAIAEDDRLMGQALPAPSPADPARALNDSSRALKG